MSARVTSWVLEHSDEEVPGRRLVLLVLADKADHDGTGAFPSVDRIAREARMTRRGVQYALRALEDAGRVRKVGLHPLYGTTEYAIVMDAEGGRNDCAPVQSDTDPVPPIAPEPSSNPSTQPADARAQARKPDPDQPPEGFPDELRPVGADVMAILQRVVDARGGKPPTKLRVGRALMNHPRKPAVQVAQRVEDWLVHGNGLRRPCKDVTARWLRWLEDCDEVLPSPGAAPAGNVVPMRGESFREQQARERKERNDRRLRIAQGESA